VGPEEECELAAERFRLASSIRAAHTLASYASDWKLFKAWCEEWGRPALPASPGTVSLYLTDCLKTRKVTTAMRRCTSIAHYHRQAGLASPCDHSVWSLLAGAQRLKCEQPNQKVAITVEQLQQITKRQLPDTPRGSRDRALLLLGFATALRRSNLRMLDLADLEFSDRGLIVAVRREKNDQLGRGRLIGVPMGKAETCPVLAVREWLAWRGNEAGPLFPGRCKGRRMHPDSIAKVVKDAVEGIGLDRAQYSGHSLRAGFVTAAVEKGCNEFTIAATTGHRSLQVLRRYFRRTDPFRACAFTAFGL
jgi:site-specific recombinase XerD